VDAYSLGAAARILGVSAARLRRWERSRLVAPSGRLGSRRAFAFRDLASARRLRELLASGIPLAAIQRSVALLRRTLPEIEEPTGALRVWARGSQRVVVRHAGVWVEPDGQAVFDFDGGSGAGTGVASLSHLAGAAAANPAGRASAARDWFERGCRLDSERASFGAAIEAYRRALEIDPELTDAHCNLGAVYYQQGRLGPARRCYERAIGLDPRHLEANLNLAMLFEDLERCESALPHYKVALEAAPLLPDVHVSLALLYEKLDLPRRGRTHWRRYLQLEPRGSWAEVARSRLAP